MTAGAANSRVLVLGYGNPGRQDDGLGPAAVAQITDMAWPGVLAQDNYQLVIEDAADIAEHDVVWFVDAARTGPGPFETQRLKANPDTAFTSHLLKPETLLAIVEGCYGKSPEAWLMAIRGYEFEFLEGLTDQARNNLAEAVAAMGRQIGKRVELAQ
jgi:hydrogenase maturation protease